MVDHHCYLLLVVWLVSYSAYFIRPGVVPDIGLCKFLVFPMLLAGQLRLE